MGILKSGAAIFEILIFWPVSANFIAKKCVFLKNELFFAIKLAETGQKIKISKIAASLFKIPIRSPPQPIFTLLGAPSSLTYVILAKNGSIFGMYGKSYTFCRTTLHGNGRQISADLI